MMTQLLILALTLCALLVLPCMIAAADLRFDLRISVGQPAEAQPNPVPPPHAAPRAKAQTGAPRPYAERSIALETDAARLARTLDTIAAGREHAAARIAAQTARRLRGDAAPLVCRLDFARRRLELIALGSEPVSARLAASALM